MSGTPIPAPEGVSSLTPEGTLAQARPKVVIFSTTQADPAWLVNSCQRAGYEVVPVIVALPEDSIKNPEGKRIVRSVEDVTRLLAETSPHVVITQYFCRSGHAASSNSEKLNKLINEDIQGAVPRTVPYQLGETASGPVVNVRDEREGIDPVQRRAIDLQEFLAAKLGEFTGRGQGPAG